MATVWWLFAFQVLSFALAFLVWWAVALRSMSAEAVAPPRSAIATLFPGSFALVMATGIVSIAAQQQGFEAVADVLFGLNVAFYVVVWVLTIASRRAIPSARP